MEKISVIVSGIGGYGANYVRWVLENPADQPIELVAAVDPFGENSQAAGWLKEKNIPLYKSLEEYYGSGHTADLALLAPPTHLHKEQSIFCMEHGSNVLCEKPVASVIDDTYAMIAAREKTGKLLGIGYQWSYSRTIQALKKDVLAGVWGKPLRLKTIVLWPRATAYYKRGTGWSAHKKSSDGSYILDSVAANATAHYLHNMLYVCGPAVDRAAEADTIEVETYRANPIEMYDTCALRAKTVSGIEMLYLVAHPIQMTEKRDPEFVYEFENGFVSCDWTEGHAHIVGHLNDGRTIDYGDPNADPARKLEWIADVLLGREDTVLCGVETASEHTKCINRIEELIPDTPHYPDNMHRFDEKESLHYCEGLADTLNKCYDAWKLPHEIDPEHYLPAQTGTVRGYKHFAPLDA